MSDGFLAFKGLAWGGGALLFAAAVLPSATNNQFDPLRIVKEATRLDSKVQLNKSQPKGIRATIISSPTLVAPTAATAATGTSTASNTDISGLGGASSEGGSGTTAGGYPELTTIPSNFDVNSELTPAHIPGLDIGDVGAFRFICGPGQVLADDPIVYPGQPGKSHLHQFYGNTEANAYSTYASLRQSGQSTCMSPLNRSGYWMAAMLDGKGHVVRPDYVTIYYKRRPASDPTVSDPTNPQYEGKAIPLPNGLRFIFGFNMSNGQQVKITQAYFNCDGPTAVPGSYPDLPTAFAHCPAGNRLGAILQAPECWDGKNLDSPDHRSHVSFPEYGNWGYLKCPAGFPYVIPHFTMGAWYSILPGDDTSKWSLASDAMFPGHPAGYTLHGDWFGAWDPNAEAMWTDNCINKKLDCSGGILGNGYMMKMYSGFSWTANPRLVPIPS